MPKQIKDFPTIAAAGDNDKLLIQSSSDNAYKHITKANLLTGLNANNGINKVSSGLVLEYLFTEGTGQQTSDTSGNNLHATFGSSTAVDAQDPTWVNWALSGLEFVPNDYLNLPTHNYFTNGQFTLEACVFVRSNRNWARIFDFGTNNNGVGGIYLSHSSGTTGRPAMGILENNNTMSFIASNIALPLRQWTYLQATFINGIGTIYLSLEPVASGSLPAPINTNRTINYIGRSRFNGDEFFDGYISLIRVYNKALNTQERVQNYLSSKAYLESKGIVL